MPSVQEVDYLDPEIANEGELATLEEFQAPREKPHIPDYSWIKSTDKLARYFPKMFGLAVKHEVWPAYVYNHVTGEARLIKDIYDRRQDPPVLRKSAAAQAEELGVAWKNPTPQERKMGINHGRWDCSGDWFPTPPDGYRNKGEPGKSVPPPSQTEVIAAAIATAMKSAGRAANNVTDQIGTIVAAVVAAMGTVQPRHDAPTSAPATVEAKPAQPQAQESEPKSVPVPDPSNEDLRDQLQAAAAAKGIKLDKRWGLDRIREELDKVAKS